MPKCMGASGIRNTDTRVTAKAAVRIFIPRLILSLLSIQDAPQMSIKVAAKNGLMSDRISNKFLENSW